MSLRSAHSHGLTAEDIVKILGNDEESKKAVALLLRYWREGRIPAEDLDEETALLLDHFRLAIPIRAVHNSLSWKMRIFSISDMEIPYIIRFFFEDLSKGCASWRETVERYFRAIGEDKPEDFVKIFEEIVERSKGLVICGEDIVEISMKYDRDGGVIIAEMKGAGLISPSVGCGGFGRAKAPLYEVNRFFALLSQDP